MLVLLGLSIVLICLSCSGAGGSSGGTTRTEHVYIAGGMGNTGDGPYPVFWKDGQLNQVELTSGTYCSYIQVSGGHVYIVGGNNANTPVHWIDGSRTTCSLGTYSGGYAKGLAVSGGDVYISGFVSDGTNDTPVYWKNGALNVLTIGGSDNNSWIQGDNIVAVGGSIYVVANTNLHSGTSYTGSTPKYWQVGSATPTALPLLSGFTDGEAAGATVSGNDWYVVGSNSGNGPAAPVYWKNGILGSSLNVTIPYTHGFAKNIAIVGSTTYLVGEVSSDPTETTSVPAIWVNGTPTILSLPASVTGNACSFHLAVSGSTVYVAGTLVQSFWNTWIDNGTPLFWTVSGGSVTASAPAYGTEPQAKISGMAMCGSDVWAPGTTGTLDANGNFVSGSPQHAGYWKNGVWSQLDIGSYAGSGAGGPFISSE